MWWLILFLSILINTIDTNRFGVLSFLLIFVWYLFTVFSFFNHIGNRNSVEKGRLSVVLVTISVYLLLIVSVSAPVIRFYGIEFSVKELLLVFFPLILSYGAPSHWSIHQKKWGRYPIILLGAIIVRWCIIRVFPSPAIDIFVMLQQGAEGLLRGENPYGMVFSSPMLAHSIDYYAYGPMSLLLEALPVWMFHDPRVLLIATDVASAYVLYLLGKKTRMAELISILYLFRPGFLSMIENAWLIPLETLLLFLIVFLLGKKHRFLMGVFLGAVIAIKFTYVSLIPLLLIQNNRKREMMVGVIIVLLCAIPFFLWNPEAFFFDTIHFHLWSYDRGFAPLFQSPTFYTWYFYLLGYPVSGYIPFLFAVGSWQGVLSMLCRCKKNEVQLVFVSGVVCFFFSLYVWYPFAFVSYYYFLTNLFLLWILLHMQKQQHDLKI